MQNFTSVKDVKHLQNLVNKAQNSKINSVITNKLDNHKTLGLLFFNPSLRTRLSTEKAAKNLGINVIILNANDGWKLEFEDGAIMNLDKAEHVKEAAAVLSQYCDILGVRSFPTLTDKAKDYADFVLNKFIEYATVPIVSLESAIRHPLQSLADLVTIKEHQKTAKPKVVLTWAPHPKALPQAVANSFSEWVLAAEYDLTIVCPKGFELNPAFTDGATISNNQETAFEGADFIYAKNWSSWKNYGQTLYPNESWMINSAKMALTNNAFFMHCLPVRRNVVVSDSVLDSPNSLVIEQANNRTFAAQSVLSEILNHQ